MDTKTFKILFFILFAVFVTTQTNADEKAHITIANELLKLIDEKKYEESWRYLGSPLNIVVNKENWSKQLESWRQPLGNLKNRVLDSTDFTVNDSGSPKEYHSYRLKYRSTYTNADNIWELVVVTNHSGSWKVLTYQLSK